MAGAAALLGAFCTLVRNGFKENLHCLLCIAENNISPIAKLSLAFLNKLIIGFQQTR